MPITAAGVGSGLDIETIVTQLMSLERQPLFNLQQKEYETEAQISDFGSLKSAVSSFKDAMDELGSVDKFRVYASASSDEDVATVTADSSAANGTYDIDIQRLAQHHKQGSSALAGGTTFGGTSGDSLSFTVDGESMSIDLSTAMDMQALRDAINDASDNPGVNATIINAGDGNQHLVLSASDSGYDKRVELSYAGSVNAGTFGFSTMNKNESGAVMSDLTKLGAAFTIDGIAATAADNEVSEVVDGLTLELKAVGTSTLSVNRDTEAIEASAQAFVDAYNGVVKKVDSLASGNIGNDGALRSVVSQLRSVLNEEASGLSGSFSTLSELGIKTNAKSGELELDSSEFQDALDADFSAVSSLFADATSGYATRFLSVAENLLDTDGILESRIDSLEDRVSGYQGRQSAIEANLEFKEKALRSRYAALDVLIGNLNSTSSFLAAQLSSS